MRPSTLGRVPALVRFLFRVDWFCWLNSRPRVWNELAKGLDAVHMCEPQFLSHTTSTTSTPPAVGPGYFGSGSSKRSALKLKVQGSNARRGWFGSTTTKALRNQRVTPSPWAIAGPRVLPHLATGTETQNSSDPHFPRRSTIWVDARVRAWCTIVIWHYFHPRGIHIRESREPVRVTYADSRNK